MVRTGRAQGSRAATDVFNSVEILHVLFLFGDDLVDDAIRHVSDQVCANSRMLDWLLLAVDLAIG